MACSSSGTLSKHRPAPGNTWDKPGAGPSFSRLLVLLSFCQLISRGACCTGKAERKVFTCFQEPPGRCNGWFPAVGRGRQGGMLMCGTPAMVVLQFGGVSSAPPAPGSPLALGEAGGCLSPEHRSLAPLRLPEGRR